MATGTVRAQLAIDGGAPVRSNPLPAWPHFSEEEIAAVEAILRSGKINYWTGEEGREFEREYAAYTGKKHAIALANGTLALELALYMLGIGPGDEVIVPSRTFLATASCAVMRGAIPVMADVDLESGNLTAETIRPLITRKTKAIIPVHLGGWPCDMDPIMSLAKEHGLKVIEDCAQAHGATDRGRPVGSIGEVNAFSFCQDKIITTGGEGGLVTTDDEEMWKRAWAYKDHGKSYDAVYKREHPPGYRWLHESFGTNWRLTEMQSALGRIQLARLPEMVATRRRWAQILDSRLADHAGLRVPLPSKNSGHAYYKYHFYVRPERLRSGWDRDRVQKAISAEGVPCFSGSCSEIYLEKAFPPELRPKHRLPNARQLGETSLMLMVHPTMGEHDIEDTASAVDKVMEVATL